MKGGLYIVLAVALLVGTLWSSAPQRTYADPAVDAKIEAVWPHDEQGREASVATAPFVNVEVYLFERGTLNPVRRDFDKKVILRWAKNFKGTYGTLIPAHDEPGRPGSAVGSRIMRDYEGKTFLAWVFNDVPIQHFTGSPVGVTTYFFVDVDGADVRTNVWAHSPDPRTYMPFDVAATAVNDQPTDGVDALIQAVWPHDVDGHYRSVAEAGLVNIGVDLFRHPASLPGIESLGFGFNRGVRLLRSLNNGFLEPVKAADKVIPVVRTGNPWPRWVFDNVDVSAAQDPANKYYFAVQVEGVTTHTTIWAHGADGRTYFPQKDVPVPGSQN